ncbi:PaaX family transcriptional regulator C-terminal domain-containing protein [Tropicimonas sp. IMCC34011]|uniref:PaaX family transcriptional regulator C-terminal domain-containing protein n=1 Tax=Tropicimonas sp. IMCC34011 TaxID=2248759 RepID=UPI000E2682E1|nr:PaaX family transcriptional regulator C-terminal domain-containing protein [Tropicimonas sp. IMCC34011]
MDISDGAARIAARDILSGPAPRAASLIVTIYGDVAAPRGGTLWMGTLIDCCARHGISESLVRTAVSRLVGAGRLQGERIGRRSYYRLTPDAEAEFSEAAGILYAPPAAAGGWLVALGLRSRPPGWASLGPSAAIAPDRADMPRPAGPVLEAPDLAPEALATPAADLWPLGEVAERFAAFLRDFAPLEDALRTEPGALPDGAEALALRLRLVDAYRGAALADPRLPASALPPDWPGHRARAIFVSTYLALAGAADAEIGLNLGDETCPMPAETEASRWRVERLRAEASQKI